METDIVHVLLYVSRPMDQNLAYMYDVYMPTEDCIPECRPGCTVNNRSSVGRFMYPTKMYSVNNVILHDLYNSGYTGHKFMSPVIRDITRCRVIGDPNFLSTMICVTLYLHCITYCYNARAHFIPANVDVFKRY